MTILRRFTNFLRGRKIPAYHHYVYVQCDSCGEAIQAHVDMRNDLSIQYGEEDQADVYFTRKSLIGQQRCFNRIEVQLTFDTKRKLIHQEIEGGKFLSKEEFLSTVPEDSSKQ